MSAPINLGGSSGDTSAPTNCSAPSGRYARSQQPAASLLLAAVWLPVTLTVMMVVPPLWLLPMVVHPLSATVAFPIAV
jgi:hypothetical protein